MGGLALGKVEGMLGGRGVARLNSFWDAQTEFRELSPHFRHTG